MSTPYTQWSATPGYRDESWRAFMVSGLWLRTGFVGASLFAIAVIALFSGDWSPVTAVATAVAGGLTAVYAWRRSWLVINRLDETTIEMPPTSPHAIGFGRGVELPASR
jgi:hypothetical protein